MTIVFAAAGASQFISINAPEARLWAIVLGAFPIATWLEASKVRSRGNPGAANTILMAGMSVQLVLWLLAIYAGDLAEGSGRD